MLLKYLFVSSLLFFVSNLTAQQPCYSLLRKEGLALLQKKNYRQAIDKLFAARYCPDKPAKDDLDALIKKTQDAWVKALDDAKAQEEALRDQAELALDKATQQRNRAESAEKLALALATKADTLRSYLQGDSTYATYLKNGKDKFRNGKYQEAIYDFAIAKFMQETDSTSYWIQKSQQALEAIKVVKQGDWDKAYDLFDRLPEIDSMDYKNYWKSNIRGSKIEWERALASNDYKEKHQLTLTYAVSIPVAIQQLSDVEYLMLNGLNLTEVPAAIGTLQALKVVDLARNKLTTLPRAFYQLTQLEVLYLNGNRFTHLPMEMSNLKQLKKLYLNANQLQEMSTTDWDFLKALKHLEALHLYGNHLSADVIAYIQSIVPENCEVLGDI